MRYAVGATDKRALWHPECCAESSWAPDTRVPCVSTVEGTGVWSGVIKAERTPVNSTVRGPMSRRCGRQRLVAFHDSHCRRPHTQAAPPKKVVPTESVKPPARKGPSK